MTETYEVKKIEKDDEQAESAGSFLKLRVFVSILILAGVILVVTK